MDYTGRIITKNPQTPSANGAPGVWTLDEAMQYSKQGKWPPGYQISRSVRLRSSASAYFNRTPSSNATSTTLTISAWVKRGTIGGTLVFIADGATSFTSNIYFNSSDQLIWQLGNQSSVSYSLTTSAVYRDPSAWYHIVCVADTSNAVSTNRLLVYVNGVQITSFASASYPTQNFGSGWTTSYPWRIASNSSSAPFYFDGYLTEINFIDGQALTPASFGYFDTYTGVWQPAPYRGTYGTNGFYLTFADNSAATAAAIGKDYSGNGNNWTPNNISVTAGTTYDSMVDVPINWGTDTGAGGEVRGNYAVFNPLDFKGSNAPTLSFANLRINAVSTAAWRASASTIAFSSQKIYCEITLNGAGSTSGGSRTFGVIGTSTNIGASGVGFSSNTGWGIAATTGTNDGAWTNGSKTTLTGITTASGTVYQIAVDGTVGSGSNKIWFGQNGTWFNSGVPSSGTNPVFSNLPSDMQFIAAILTDSGYDLDVNFGQRAFSYTAPTGFQALCTQNISVPTVLNGASYMAATLYSGNGGTLSVSNGANNTIGTTFQPDWVWVKSRSAATDHKLTDSVRGATKALISDTTGAETTDTNGVTAFGTTGFTLGSDTVYNNSGATYVGWQWKANGTAVSNTAGTITSSVSANTSAGFSILTYTGTGATATIGHGLGATPSMMIMKKRSNVGAWKVYHTILGNTKILELNATDAAQTSSTYWNNTSPTSTLITVGSNGDINASGETYVSYCFAPITGYSAFTTYTGNGSGDGPFVYCGFRPRWLMIKRYDAAGDPWWLVDSTRSPYNQTTLALRPSAANAEDNGGNANFDFLANGFKARTSGGGNGNESGATYIVAAFAENPFTIARAR